MKIKNPEIGICGLSCRLCPFYHAEGASKCGGCKSEYRIGAGCPFITCAIKKKKHEFCWECAESGTCPRWHRHRESGKGKDSFVCYQKLEDNIAFIKRHGVDEFDKIQKVREQLLSEMLFIFNEGRSRRFYCIAATVLEIKELQTVLNQAKKEACGLEIKDKSRVLRRMLNEIAKKNNYNLSLRK